MRKILPILFFLVLTFSFLTLFVPRVYAVDPTPTPDPNAAGGGGGVGIGAAGSTDGQWVQDAEVTFIGKTASRSASFLDWTLQNYQWLCVTKDPNNQYFCNNNNDPLIPFWVIIRNIVYAFLALFVLGTAFILIITRGQNITVMRFIPRFVFIIVLITLSFSLVQVIYQATDIVQDFFLKNNGTYISTQDLLYMGFSYQDFQGYRVSGDQYAESAFISLLLVRLTAITYYVMTGILLIRKIILWFFIIISPILPLLLFYKPIRNTAKIWVGEFFRWLLYAPLFAVFLRGLVVVWKAGIPLPFIPTDGSVVYPTAINILLGGPGQRIYYNGPGVAAGSSNSVNLPDTFALYVVALLMLWVVILLPFLLLKIFLDYLGTLSLDNNVVLKQAANRFSFLNPSKGVPPASPKSPPGAGQPAGSARALPFYASKGAAVAPIQIKSNIQESVRESSEILRSANLSIPKMRDIAQYETSFMSSNQSQRSQVTEMHSNLSKIANPSTAIVASEREKFTTVRQQLLDQKQKGNPIASSVLAASAASITTKAENAVKDREGHLTAAVHAQTQTAALPSVNHVQQVSLEDYEEVRNLWTENYENIDPPKDLSGNQIERQQWIKNDMDKINQAIALLSSPEPEKVNQGMSMVANILPFLLIGGFSKSEVVAYLKAKMEAGKSVLSQVQKKETEEDSMVSTQKKETAEPREMSEAVAASIPDKEKDLQQGPMQDNEIKEEKPQ